MLKSLARITGERVRMLENGVLKRLFVPKAGEANVGRTEVLNERHYLKIYRLLKGSLC